MNLPILALLLLAFSPAPLAAQATGRPESAPAGAAALPATMKAIRMHAFGGADVLSLDEVPLPVPKATEILIHVHAAGVNPVDWKFREGKLGKNPAMLPLILGGEVSGTVEAVGRDVTNFQRGDEVFGMFALAHWGGYAEYATASAADFALKPASIDHVHAAGIPLAGLTAYQALVSKGNLGAGQTVLIHAGSGGVGHFAIQIAKARGAKVIATASGKNLEFLKQLGADVAIDYTTQRFEELAHDVDLVLDTIGGDTQQRSLAVLKKGGLLVSVLEPVDLKESKERGVRGMLLLVKPNAKDLAELAKLVEAKQLSCTVSERFPLAEAARAQTLSQTGHVRGKLVLELVK